ncbi:MAG TPA: NAD(P)/FAD-dependent oxidoreductase [Gemmatimonadaceae bacterium]|nr:NAD(P)/FAD-dependent oxidoreductase [Gemmatimonadaceae bacterium]
MSACSEGPDDRDENSVGARVDRERPHRTTLVIGAGPAGLTTAYLLGKAGHDVVVLEADRDYVGGLSRTVAYKGFRFDIGGHRFFSKSPEVEALWTELLGHEMLERPRLSRIYYNGKFFAYPVRAGNALRNLGPVEAALCALSYLKASLFPVKDPRSFEDWVSNQFGWRLYRMFFKTYTEKVWGMKCSEISADWAAQRIKGLSMATTIRRAIFRRENGDNSVRTLIESFRYPRLGPGMMWEACRDAIVAQGGGNAVLMGRRVVRCRFDAGEGAWEVTARTDAGAEEVFRASDVVSSAPMREIVESIEPPAPAAAREAARGLRYRDFMAVALIMKERANLPDNWIYVHDPSVRVGRIQIFKSWSPDLVPDPSLCCFGMEYFCFEGDELWSKPDAEVIAAATDELARIGLGRHEDVVDGCVVRARKAYPVYDGDYADRVARIRREIAHSYPGMHFVGRNGMHKYNNQDHAMMTGMLTARNIIAGTTLYDVWAVNEEAEYLEAATLGGATGERLVPQAIRARPLAEGKESGAGKAGGA